LLAQARSGGRASRTWARYKTPIDDLYLCGNGTHPGTGLTGGSAANAAREILKALKK